jgi:hypothetical protein
MKNGCLLMLLLGKMIEYYHLEWLIWGIRFLLFYLLWYEYKAMRHFYGQRRVKTIFKFAIAFLARLLILIIVMFLFGIISFLKV